MRQSQDIYKTVSGELVTISPMEQPPAGSQIWNGYDYENQCWVFEGKMDTRTIEQLRESVKIR